VSNYRYYTQNTVHLVIEIENLKKKGLTLDEIAKILHIEKNSFEEINIQAVRIHMQQLEKEVKLLAEQLKANPQTSNAIKKNVLPESAALMQSLLLLIP
jgi:MerR family transcriptional regulator, copper efflux regulator